MSEEQTRTVTPIQSVTVSSLAYEQLKRAILRGAFEPGERLVESRLAKDLTVSRTPLREAMRTLELEGLLERVPNGGMQVPPFSVKEIVELYELRATLESYAAGKAAQRVQARELRPREAEQINLMRGKLLAGVDNSDRAGALESVDYTTNFHLLVNELSDNQRCISILQNLMDAMRRYRSFVPPDRSRVGLEEHLAILDAIAAGDQALAVNLMRKHIEESGVLYRDRIAQIVRQDKSTVV